MTKKKKTFRKFINEEILKIEPPKKGKEFGSFKEFVNDVKGYQPPEKPELQTETFKEFVDKTKGPEKNFVPDYINPTQKQIEEINKRRIIEEINEVLKYRDPVLNKMSFQEWLKIPQNFFVFELSNEQAKRLYEQDMSRVEKYEEINKKSGKGRNRVAVTVAEEEPWTPARLATGDKDYWWNPDSITGLSDGAAVSSFADSVQSYVLTQGTGSQQPSYQSSYTFGTKSAAAIVSEDGDGFTENIIPLELTSGELEITLAFVCKMNASLPTVSNQVENHIGYATSGASSDYYKRFGVNIRRKNVRLISPNAFASYGDGSNILSPPHLALVIMTASGGNATLQALPGIMPTALTDTYTPNTAPTGTSRLFHVASSAGPTAYGETLVVSRAITASEIAQLQAYWADKYGT